MLSAVLVDLYGTLVADDDAPVADVCARLAARGRVPAATVAQAWDAHLWAAADSHGDDFRGLADLTHATLRHVAGLLGVPVDADAELAVLRAAWRRPRLLPDAREFLAGIDVPVCVVSDADRADACAAVAHHGLPVTTVVTSEDVRAYKPRPEPFRRALELLGVDAADVVHVGDSGAADVVGAAAVGIRTVHVDRAGRGLPPGVTATHGVRTLADVRRAF
ncbi:HAD family hydrolase [Cellulomonas shaoxiangyii]|uniref:HAD family hydrolase n=1 Tax=Cellulomonas shaoxiangyii TaxID=2566013 RepID=A0A4P7SNH8_9CELL|nr:HAD family hydrolase [Cellulomonas shaoxiangyii]QCB94826.1 HAD family hydrolase [Cellulomonas shaoxiangyii]TGY86556.1 HAD family hydrolase [Cellulomonas shaoxiangyii]